MDDPKSAGVTPHDGSFASPQKVPGEDSAHPPALGTDPNLLGPLAAQTQSEGVPEIESQSVPSPGQTQETAWDFSGPYMIPDTDSSMAIDDGVETNPGVPASQGTDSDETDAVGSESSGFDINAIDGADSVTLLVYLHHPDPAVQSAAFHALSAIAPDVAQQALLSIADNPADPLRLQTFQLLVSTSDLKDESMLASVRTALKDHDLAVVDAATQVLAGRRDGEALRLLADTFREVPSPTRLQIVRAIAGNDAAVPILYLALNDPSDDVSRTANAILLGNFHF